MDGKQIKYGDVLNKMCYINDGDTIFMDNCCFLQRVENKLPCVIVYLAGEWQWWSSR